MSENHRHGDLSVYELPGKELREMLLEHANSLAGCIRQVQDALEALPADHDAEAPAETRRSAVFLQGLHRAHHRDGALTMEPIPMLIWCPECRARHLDDGEFATRPHHTHACQNCGNVWRPAIVDTVGVRFLPGFKD